MSSNGHYLSERIHTVKNKKKLQKNFPPNFKFRKSLCIEWCRVLHRKKPTLWLCCCCCKVRQVLQVFSRKWPHCHMSSSGPTAVPPCKLVEKVFDYNTRRQRPSDHRETAVINPAEIRQKRHFESPVPKLLVSVGKRKVM